MTTDISSPEAGSHAGPVPHPRRSRYGAGGAARSFWTAIVLLVALAASIGVAVTIGPAEIGIGDVWRTIVAQLRFDSVPTTDLHETIVWNIRLTRVLTAAAVGAALAMSGAVMQAITRNQLADPFLLGLSSGASVGAVAVLILGATLLLPVAAFLGALAALTVTLLLTSSLGALTPSRTILAGVTVSAFASAIASLLIFWNVQGDSYREILNWLLGSLAGAGWSDVLFAWIAVIVVGIPLSLGGRVLDAFVFGETAAATLGVNVRIVRWLLLGGAALITGVAVAVSGAIGFVGLVLPNAVRLIAGFQHRAILPLCGILGAIFMIWVDTGARTLFEPRELPVGIITILVGAPVFALVLWRNRARA